jgi:hypothetical protein
MRTIRVIPIGLLLLLFVSNLYLGIITSPGHGFAGYLIFSAVYLAIGLLMMSKLRFAEWIGFLIPVAIFSIYPMILDFKNLHPWSSGALSMFNAMVIICCFILLLLKLKN